MRSKSQRIRDAAMGWFVYAVITFYWLPPVILFAASLWKESRYYTPLLPYLNPIWVGPAVLTFFGPGLLTVLPQLLFKIVVRPDFAAYYISRWLGNVPVSHPITLTHCKPRVITLLSLKVLLRLVYGPPSTQDSGRPTAETEVKSGTDVDPALVEREVKEPRMEKFLIPPLLFPARTTHTRFFPEKHSFAYSYFYVGIPIGWRGRSGIALSADVEELPLSKRKFGWFDVNSADYLNRSSTTVSLESKLKAYLRSEGVKDEEWTFAYLCTAPRFLGYSFNPVSFWYIYGLNSELKWMLLEVNNTFDERRMYLLSADDESGSPNGTQAKFKKSWTKDFHVSPFNSRKGSYSLQAGDPYKPGKGMEAAFDNTITLRSSKNETKLVARVFSESQAIDPSAISNWQLFKFILGWFWVGFMTSPRIIFQAFKLFFLRKLHVWYRPEVLPTSLGRHATLEEKQLESYFAKHVNFMVERSQMSIEVLYVPPGDMGEKQTFVPQRLDKGADPELRLQIKILSPAFYSRYVHYAHATEAFNREGLCTDEKNRTVMLSRPEVLDALLQEDLKRPSIGKRYSALEKWRWDQLHKLRCAPPPVSYEEKEKAHVLPGFTVEDIRATRLSGLDRFVMERVPSDDARQYRAMVTKAFLAQRYAFGMSGLVSFADHLLCVTMTVAAYKVTAVMLASADVWFVPRDKSDLVLAVGGSLTGEGLVHIWNVIKGA